MRLIPAAPVVVLLCLIASAQQADAPQIAAAVGDALDRLRTQVLAAGVTPTLSVKDFLDRTGRAGELDKTLHSAEQVGGTRWLDEQTAQVRLVIGGDTVAAALVKISQEEPGKSPVPPQRLQQDLSGWAGRTFSATGTSAGAEDIERIRPPADDRAWQAVPDTERRRALAAARQSAINNVVNSLRPIQTESGKPLETILSNTAVDETVRKWLAGRPAKSVQFGDDLLVRVTLAAAPEAVADVLKAAAERQHLSVASGPAGWDRLRDQITARMAPPIGAEIAHSSQPARQDLPAAPPAWSMQQAEAQGLSEAHGNKLQTARQAEALADEKLRQQINALPLEGSRTVGDAAKANPRLQEAISRALGRARPFKVDYGAKGSVVVHVELNLSDLWAEMSGQN